jgi:hypothetical protein
MERSQIKIIVAGPNWLEFVYPALEQDVSITFDGWKWLSERPRSAGHRGFIAMWFDSSLDELQRAIEKGISDAGYSPLRIDQDHFAGGVMDRVLASIRESRFVVADFTGNRGGVYYEAGFAAGLGLTVFCLCKEGQTAPGDADRIHFDIAHLRMITWKGDDLGRLTDRLRDGICAVVGRGPISPKETN